MLNDKLLGLIYGAFIGDAIALGPHWIYNTQDIQTHFHPIEGYTSPTHTPYHPSKKAGDFTHYGDQSLLLLKSIAEDKEFNLASFKKRWLHYITHEQLYIDHASKTSIPLLTGNTSFLGSDSDELAGFSRSAPLFALGDVDNNVFNQQIGLTHNNIRLYKISDFFVDVIKGILSGQSIDESIESNLVVSDGFIRDAYRVACEQHGSIIETVKAIGQSCSSNYGFPSVLAILEYSKSIDYDFYDTLVQNVYAGGDSASRGMILGMILGSNTGYKKIPKHLIEGLNKLDEIKGYLAKL